MKNYSTPKLIAVDSVLPELVFASAEGFENVDNYDAVYKQDKNGTWHEDHLVDGGLAFRDWVNGDKNVCVSANGTVFDIDGEPTPIGDDYIFRG